MATIKEVGLDVETATRVSKEVYDDISAMVMAKMETLDAAGAAIPSADPEREMSRKVAEVLGVLLGADVYRRVMEMIVRSTTPVHDDTLETISAIAASVAEGEFQRMATADGEAFTEAVVNKASTIAQHTAQTGRQANGT